MLFSTISTTLFITESLVNINAARWACPGRNDVTL